VVEHIARAMDGYINAFGLFNAVEYLKT